ncbi:MAG: hypothetical protein GXP01_04830 [Alphaproteobacteria bacterium]|nr:hypothetical protein [Alphaproteobacteria bacterium]
MRTLIALIVFVLGTTFGSLAMAAEILGPPPVLPPPTVENGLEGVFYLRGSVDVNAWWARDADYACGCIVPITDMGYGYSFGVGVGFETSRGMRWDVTLDRIVNNGLSDGVYTADLTTTLAMMNAYYDFGFNGGPPVSGEMGAYVGAGLGMGYNQTVISGGVPTPPGNTFSGAAAVMAGVTYDMGQAVADIGYRAVYMPQITNGDAALFPFYINQNVIHELRGTLRYRFN